MLEKKKVRNVSSPKDRAFANYCETVVRQAWSNIVPGSSAFSLMQKFWEFTTKEARSRGSVSFDAAESALSKCGFR